MGRHGSREAEVDDLLRHEVFVDLYAIVRHGLRVGEPGYSIKNLERLYRPARAGEVTSALDSIAAYEQWLASGEARDWKSSPLLQAIRAYNQDDCESTRQLTHWLRERQQEVGIESVGSIESIESVESDPTDPTDPTDSKDSTDPTEPTLPVAGTDGGVSSSGGEAGVVGDV